MRDKKVSKNVYALDRTKILLETITWSQVSLQILEVQVQVQVQVSALNRCYFSTAHVQVSVM